MRNDLILATPEVRGTAQDLDPSRLLAALERVRGKDVDFASDFIQLC